MRRMVLAGILAAVVAGVPVAAGQRSYAEEQPARDRVEWVACPQLPDPPPGLRCGRLRVPLAWADPDGARIDLALRVAPATDTARRIGSLFINPGGPGGSATQVVDHFTGLLPADLRRRFDIVGLDPRGVGESTPFACDAALQPTIDDLTPHSTAEFDAMTARTRAYGRSCLAGTGPLLAHLDTVSVARDLEAARAALGEEPLNWLGFSYGSAIGAAYAELFPRRIRVLAGDGILDHSRSLLDMARDEALAAEDAFGRFSAWCGAEPSCPLYGQPVTRLFDELTTAADASPVPAPAAGTSASGTTIRHGVQQFLLTPAQGWPRLAQAIVDARNGDASAFATASAGSLFARPIECHDYVTPISGYPALARAHAELRRLAPHLRGAVQSWTMLAGCVDWPVPAANPQHRLRIRGNPPILYVNSTHDPSTSYGWARHVAAATPRGVLLTFDGDGHTSYLTSPCTAALVNKYLIDRQVPARGTVCR